MTHYEERLSKDLDEIRRRVGEISNQVCAALKRSVNAAVSFDKAEQYEVAIDDFTVNRSIRKLDKRCHEFVAVHLPAAKHLRFISSVLRMTIALERAGDYAVTVGRVSLQLGKPVPVELREELQSMTETAVRMMSEAVDAFLKEDCDRAIAAKALDYKVDKTHDAVFEELMGRSDEWKASELLSMLKIFGRVERFSDQAKNVCEETVFVITGQMKRPKVFKILFVDEKNDFLSQLACAIAEKALPEKGIFSSAGWNPAKTTDPHLEKAAEILRLDLSSCKPTRLDHLDGFPTQYHVVVGINLPDDTVLPHIPYYTILVNWNVDVKTDDFQTLGKDLSARVNTLVRRLRGKNE